MGAMATEELHSSGTDEADRDAVIMHAARSDIGMRREENQDSFGILEGDGYKLFIVADGMGGVKGGALASSLAIETMKSSLANVGQPTNDDVVQAIQRANAEIFAKGSADASLNGMGTTFVALYFQGNKLTVFNVGDSRAYRFRQDQVDRLSEDHTLVMELVRSGTIDVEQAANHPVSHMLTRSLGPAEEVEVDVIEVGDGPYQSDLFLICSDGLYNHVKDGEMLALMQENRLESAVEKLIELANKRGGTDNITIIAVEAGDGFPELPEALRPVDIDIPEEASQLAGAEEESEEDSEREQPAQADASKKEEKKSESQSANGAAGAEKEAQLNGASKNGHASAEERISLEQLRSAYAEKKAQTKSDPKATTERVVPPGLKARLDRAELHSRERQARPSVLEEKEKRGVFSSKVTGFLSLLGAAICGSMVSVLFLSPEGAVEPLAANVAAPLGDAASRAGSKTVLGQTDVSDISTNNNANAGQRTGSSGGFPGSFEAGLSTIDRRQKTLSSRLRQVDEKIAALDAPLSGQIGQLLNEASKQLEILDSRVTEVRAEIDSSARKLAVWTGRRKRLETSEPINMVSEVSVSSEDVRKKKEAFEAATWQYLKEAERLEYSPNDPTLSNSVADFVRQRNQRMEELFASLRTAIDSGVLESQQRISDLSVEKDRLEAEIRSLQDTISFSRLLASSDRTTRTVKRAELVRERELILAELNELNRLADTLPALRGGQESASDRAARTGR